MREGKRTKKTGRRRKRRKLKACLSILILISCMGLTGYVGYVGTKTIKEFYFRLREVPYPKIQIEEETLKNKYYYGLLEKEEKLIYKELLQGLSNLEDKIYLHSDDFEKTKKIFQFVINDNPQIFWCEWIEKMSLYKGKEIYCVVNIDYLCKGKELEQKKEKIEREVEKILQNAPKNVSEYEQIKYVYEYIAEHTEYDKKSSDNQNIYSVFGNGRSVCAGYARATQYLLEKMGIFCTYISGIARDPQTYEAGRHAWNLVLCDGDYYYVDTTWGDPISADENKNFCDIIQYDYLCINDEELFRTHTPNLEIPVPACTSMRYNYYVMNGTYYTSYSRSEILQAMKDSIDKNKKDITIKFVDSNVYWEAKEEILDEVAPDAAEYFSLQHQLQDAGFSYLIDEDLNKMSFIWGVED